MHPLSLTTLVDEQLGAARTAGNGRSARTVHGDHEHALRQTLIALFAGSELADSSPGEATLQVLHARVRLTTATDSREAVAGDHLVIPAERHGLTAVDDGRPAHRGRATRMIPAAVTTGRRRRRDWWGRLVRRIGSGA
jgi:quercetin dioxygenase-like cupin family protein